MSYQEYAKKVLTENHFKITKPKSSILEILSKTKKPLNPYEIAKKSKSSKLDISTIYRVLEVFRKINLVHFVKDKQGFVPCENQFCREKTHCHHQFICSKCSAVQEFHVEDSPFIKTLSNKLPDVKIESHYLELSGLCKKCK